MVRKIGRGSQLPYNGTLLLIRRWAIVVTSTEQTADFCDERLRIARLHHDRVEAGRTREIELLDVRVTSRGDQRNCASIRARLEFTRDLVPGFPREFEVHHDDVGLFSHGFGECALAVRRRQDIEAFGAQVDSPHVECVGIVVNDQETWV